MKFRHVRGNSIGIPFLVQLAMSITPNFKWAQNKTHLFVTIEVPDCQDVKVDLKESQLTFRCAGVVCALAPAHRGLFLFRSSPMLPQRIGQ